jgi:beta-glucanase (GH16 family)
LISNTNPITILVGALLLAGCGLATKGPTAPALSEQAGWKLSWSDEFNAPDGSVPDPSKWNIEVAGNGFGNQELEYYTNRPQNAQIQNGNLVITARKETYTGPDSVVREYTSARLNTANKFHQAYGRFEARIKIPYGQGMWPAFWLLGTDTCQDGWPACGEVDVMENIGREPASIHGTIHGPGYSGDHGIGSPFSFPDGRRFADDFHVYAVEWTPEQIKFFVDDNLYATRAPSDLPAGSKWVFNHPFFLILNLAVGGAWPGAPDTTTAFPQQMLVDYVRVFSR